MTSSGRCACLPESATYTVAVHTDGAMSEYSRSFRLATTAGTGCIGAQSFHVHGNLSLPCSIAAHVLQARTVSGVLDRVP